MSSLNKNKKEDYANSSLSISNITTGGNLLITSNSNSNLKNNNLIPKTQINLFNQIQKNPLKQTFLTKTKKVAEPFKIISKDENITVNISTNPERVKAKNRTITQQQTRKRGNSVNTPKNENKTLNNKSENNRSCSNIKPLSSKKKNLLISDNSNKNLLNKNMINLSNKKKGYAKSFIGINTNNENSSTNSNNNTQKSSSNSNTQVTKKINQNSMKNINNKTKYNSLRPSSRSKINNVSIKSTNEEKDIKTQNKTKKSKEKKLTLDLKIQSAPSLKLKPQIDEEEIKYRQKIKELDNINDTNLTSLLYLITKCENILTNQLSTFISSYSLNTKKTNQQILDINLAKADLISEIESFNTNITELNNKIELINPNIEKINIDSLKEESEQRKLIYNECFEQCYKNIDEITNLLKIKKPNKKISKRMLLLKRKSKLASKRKMKISSNINIEDVEEDTFLGSDMPVSVNIPRLNNFNVKKPKEQNLKYKPYEERSDIFESEEDDNLNISGVSKIVIGEIEAYKDIIEQDKINMFKHQRSKSSFNLHNKIGKKDFFKNIRILDEDSEISDLDEVFESSEEDEEEGMDGDKFEGGIKDIEDEYNFEENEKKKKIKQNNKKNHLLPYHISKISFCKIFDESNGAYTITEKVENKALPLTKDIIKKKKSKSKRAFNNNNNSNKKETNLEIQKEKECLIF